VSVLHYDGTPITARFVTEEIAEKAAVFNVRPLRAKERDEPVRTQKAGD